MIPSATTIAQSLGNSRRAGNGFLCQCPAHEDARASLSIADGANGAPVLKCHAGCDNTAIIQELKHRDLWHSEQKTTKKREAACYDYRDKEGKLLYQAVRYEPKGFSQRRPDGNGGFIHNLHSVSRVPFNLPAVVQAIGTGETVHIVEGEKDAERLRQLELVATTNNGGAGKWTDELSRYLTGCRQVVILPDNDEPGKKHAEQVAASLSKLQIANVLVSLPGLPEKGDVSDWLDAGGTREQLDKLVRAAVSSQELDAIFQPESGGEPSNQAADQTIQWEAPLLFGQIETPGIPTSLLPGWLGVYADAIARSTQTPPAMSVMLALATVATCLQGKFVVSPYGDDYAEPVNIWTCIALAPGNRKSAVVKAFTAPLNEWEREQLQKLKTEIAKARTTQEIAEKRIEELTKKAAKSENTDDRKSVADEIATIREELRELPRNPRLWTSDTTAERLQAMLCDYDERMSVLSDEGGIFEVMSGLYSDGKCNVDVFLQAHAGSEVRVDRAGRTVILRRPALTFGITVQPAIVADLAQGHKSKFRGNGTLARFLYCIPKSTVGHRDVSDRNPIPESVSTQYAAGLYSLLKIQARSDKNGDHAPHVISLSPEASQCFIAFAQFVESHIGEGRDLESLQDWMSKLPGASLRIAGLMHVAEHGLNTRFQINQVTMQTALDLCELLIVHAQAAYDLMSNDPSTQDAKYVLTWLLKERRESFKQTDVFRLGRFNRSKVNRLEKALDVLVERHMVSARHSESTRKPTYVYRVNPAIYEEGD